MVAWNLERILSALPFLSVTSGVELGGRSPGCSAVPSREWWSVREPNAGDGGAVETGDQSGVTVSLLVERRYGVEAEESAPVDDAEGDE